MPHGFVLFSQRDTVRRTKLDVWKLSHPESK